MTTMLNQRQETTVILEETFIFGHNIQLIEKVFVQPSEEDVSSGLYVTCDDNSILYIPPTDSFDYYQEGLKQYTLFCTSIERLCVFKLMNTK